MIPHDRRSTSRFDTGNLVIHSDVGMSPAAPCLGLGVTLDMNEFGTRLQHAEAFTVGDRWRFRIAIGDEVVEAVGRVVHVTRTLNGTFEAGVEFLEIGQPGVDLIRRHGKSRSNPSV